MAQSTSAAQVQTWTPAILSDYEMGKVMAAIEIVAATSKAIVEIAGRNAIGLSELVSDLEQCVSLSGLSGVRVWTRESGGRVRYGIYREKWALDALDFLDRTSLSSLDRAWISGLLFGYRSEAIQQFIEKNGCGSWADSSRPSDTAKT